MGDTGYLVVLKSLSEVDGPSRVENLNELKSVVLEYEADDANDASLAGFLERISLVSDVDKYDPDEDAVVLMTIHSAKGLEFPIVYLPGLENGIFPGQMTLEEEDLEEERRLCYVAITRAREELIITRAERRMLFGKTLYQPESSFITEIPSKYLDIKNSIPADFTQGAKTLGFFSQKKPIAQKPIIPEGESFAPGDRIAHPKFGTGTVMSSEQFGRDFKLEVIFDSGEKKMLMAAFAKLQKI